MKNEDLVWSYLQCRMCVCRLCCGSVCDGIRCVVVGCCCFGADGCSAQELQIKDRTSQRWLHSTKCAARNIDTLQCPAATTAGPLQSGYPSWLQQITTPRLSRASQQSLHVVNIVIVIGISKHFKITRWQMKPDRSQRISVNLSPNTMTVQTMSSDNKRVQWNFPNQPF